MYTACKHGIGQPYRSFRLFKMYFQGWQPLLRSIEHSNQEPHQHAAYTTHKAPSVRRPTWSVQWSHGAL
eukprot:scaffold100615_cov17-Tisochrysis_lutea.AAC.3